jgi:Membrane MotB of proton-channel complex MotA/MotB
MARLAQAERGEPGDSSIVLLLSLNLILLAFFILLNAISEFEEAKTRQVIDSVNQAFYGQLEPTNAPALLNGSPGLLPEAEALTNDVGSLFEPLVATVRSTRTARTRAVHIELPSNALFGIGKDSLRSNRKALFQRLAKTLLRRRARDLVYNLEILHGVPASGATGAARAQEIRRVSGIVALLIGEGLTPEMLSIGVLPGKPGKVELVLSVREAPVKLDRPDSDGPESARQGASR